MAYQVYEEDQSIHSMTTRQLRLYIKDKAQEANERLKSLNLDLADKALKEAVDSVTQGGNKVKSSTSNMDKAQMREYAYALRTFTTMDTESGYAQKTEWQKNKARYQKFMQNRIAEGDEYWKQYQTEKGNISKKGYEDYKEYIAFLKEVESIKYQFTYKTITQYAKNQLNKEDSSARLKAMSKILNKVYAESKGKHMTSKELIDAFYNKWDEYEEASSRDSQKLKAPKYKSKQTKSSSNVKAKQGRKMKTHGTVHK